MAKKILLASVCVLAVVIWFLQSLGPRPAPPPSAPSEAREPLLERFPFLGDFQRASWVGGVRDDRGPLAPSSHFIRAYVVLRPEQTRLLQTKYSWVEAPGERIPDPGYSLGEGFPGIEGTPMKSDDLARQLPGLTTYNGGVIRLLPDVNLLFLDLVND